MKDAECVALRQRALPRLELRWVGFRRVRRQVCRRSARRIAELGLRDLAFTYFDDARQRGAFRKACA